MAVRGSLCGSKKMRVSLHVRRHTAPPPSELELGVSPWGGIEAVSPGPLEVSVGSPRHTHSGQGETPQT